MVIAITSSPLEVNLSKAWKKSLGVTCEVLGMWSFLI